MTTSPSPCRRRLGRTATKAAAVLVAVAGVTVPASAAQAGTGAVGDGDSPGCVSNGEYAKLAIGQRLSFVRSVAGGDAQVSMRRWDRGIHSYQERLFGMCTPMSSQHDTLTARFMMWQGAWRATIIDTYVGPE